MTDTDTTQFVSNLDTANIPDVLASMIHDIKNRLFDAASALGEKHPDVDQIRDSVFVSAERMDRMLIAYRLMRHESHKTMAVMSDVNVQELIEDAILQIPDGKSKIRLTQDAAYGDNWLLSRDPVIDALVNGVRNAMRYARSDIRIASFLEDEWLVIEINDNGPGYPFQLNNSCAASPIKGIGLFVARRVMRMHIAGNTRGMLTLDNGGSLGGALLRLRFPPFQQKAHQFRNGRQTS